MSDSDSQSSSQDDSDEELQLNRPLHYYYKFPELKKDQQIQIALSQRTFDELDSYDVIYYELEVMEDDGYDFRYSCKDYVDKKRKGYRRKTFLRKAQLSYLCKNQQCPYFKLLNKFNRWTTFYGLVQYKFAVKRIYQNQTKNFQQIKYPFKVEFRFRIYRQLCRQCGKWTDGEIYESKLVTISRMFCYIVAQMVEYPQILKKKPEKNQKLDQDEYNSGASLDEDKKHKKTLCQACKEGKCKHIRRKTQGPMGSKQDTTYIRKKKKYVQENIK